MDTVSMGYRRLSGALGCGPQLNTECLAKPVHSRRLANSVHRSATDHLFIGLGIRLRQRANTRAYVAGSWPRYRKAPVRNRPFMNMRQNNSAHLFIN